MKFNLKMTMLVCLFVSIAAIIVGYFLWTIFIPIQDFHLMDDKEVLRIQKVVALNYSLGKSLLHGGFFGLFFSSIYLITNKIKKKQFHEVRLK